MPMRYGQSYKTVAPMDAFDHDGEDTQIAQGQQFECKSTPGSIPDQILTGPKIRSNGADFYITDAVANLTDNSVWKSETMPVRAGGDGQAKITDWDVGEGRGDGKTGGQMTGFGSRGAGLDLRTEVKWGPTVQGVEKPEGTWMEATMLGPEHPRGSGPSGDCMTNAQILKKATNGHLWVGGHLLNDNLGGPGDDVRNIAAIPEHPTNSNHSAKVEEKIKEHINENGGYAYYRVDVTHEQRKVPRSRGHAGGTFAVAARFTTKWQKLAADGLPIGNLQVDQFPVPSPEDINAGDSKEDEDNHHQRLDAVPPPGGQSASTAAVQTGTFLGHPTSEPLTVKLKDYDGQGLESVPQAFPHKPELAPANLRKFADTVLFDKKARGGMQLLVRTSSLIDTIDKSSMKLNRKRVRGTETEVLEKKPKGERPKGPMKNTEKDEDHREDLMKRVMDDVTKHPDGHRAHLAKGWAIEQAIEGGSDAATKDPNLATDPLYLQWLQFKEAGDADFDEWLAAQT